MDEAAKQKLYLAGASVTVVSVVEDMLTEAQAVTHHSACNFPHQAIGGLGCICIVTYKKDLELREQEAQAAALATCINIAQEQFNAENIDSGAIPLARVLKRLRSLSPLDVTRYIERVRLEAKKEEATMWDDALDEKFGTALNDWADRRKATLELHLAANAEVKK